MDEEVRGESRTDNETWRKGEGEEKWEKAEIFSLFYFINNLFVSKQRQSETKLIKHNIRGSFY